MIFRRHLVYKVNEFGITMYPYPAMQKHGAIREEGKEADSGRWAYLVVNVTYTPPQDKWGIYRYYLRAAYKL